MLLAVLRRLWDMVVSLFGISVLVFLLFFATPGSEPAARIAGRNASPETIAAVRQSFGLDQPLPFQYLSLMKKLFITMDLTSFVNRGYLVIPAILDAAPVTLSLVMGAAIVWVLFGLAVGVAAGAARNTWVDRTLMILSLVGVAMPVFWLGAVVNLITQSRLHDTWAFSWVLPLGYKPFVESPKAWFLTLVLPCLTLAIGYIGIYGRVLRANIIEAMQEDYIRTARAKGLSEGRILLRHALRMSLVSIVSLFGLDLGLLIGGGALLTEVVFALNGVGKLLFDSLLNLDLPVVLGVVNYAAFFIISLSTLIDVLYIFVDPRVRTDG
jgi:peptide/nickel transport system permease protein